jgi:Mg/Co/Ni transporter MgtE
MICGSAKRWCLVPLPRDATLEDAVEALLRTSQHEFPVVDEYDRVLGVLTRDDIIAALRRYGRRRPSRASCTVTYPSYGRRMSLSTRPFG